MSQWLKEKEKELNAFNEQNKKNVPFLMGFISSMTQNSKKGNEKLKKYFYSLLTSPEEIALFDSEMFAPPLCKIKFTDFTGEVSFTKHFLLHTSGSLPNINYQIIKLQDIKVAKTYVSNTHSNMLGAGKKYATTFFNANNEIIGDVDIINKDEFDAFINALCLYLPDLKLEQDSPLS